LAQLNDSFRGSSDKLYTEKNGKFLGLIEMIKKFDPIISEHVRRIKCKKTFEYYLGPEIQNELINLMANDIKKKLLVWCIMQNIILC